MTRIGQFPPVSWPPCGPASRNLLQRRVDVGRFPGPFRREVPCCRPKFRQHSAVARNRDIQNIVSLGITQPFLILGDLYNRRPRYPDQLSLCTNKLTTCWGLDYEQPYLRLRRWVFWNNVGLDNRPVNYLAQICRRPHFLTVWPSEHSLRVAVRSQR